MLSLTAREIAELSGGRITRGDPTMPVTGVAIDTRRVAHGDVFVALRGDHADGHAFTSDAFARGASLVIVREEPAAVAEGVVIVVPEPRDALMRLAAGVRPMLNARVVAITGSSGKTITKELTAAVARTRFRVTASEASFNNEIGVPLTLLAADESTEVVVAEVGSRGRGHIAGLMPILRPDVSVVLNVGLAHVGLFGSIEVTAQAKSELIETLSNDAFAILNADDDLVANMASRTKANVVTFGRSPSADVRAEQVTSAHDGTSAFRLVVNGNEAGVRMRIPGEHLVHDALAAAAVGHVLGIPAAETASGLSKARGPAWRMEVLAGRGEWRILNDAYNANPSSMAAALRTLVAMGKGMRTWAVLGHMAELGDASVAEHDRMGRLAVRLGISRLVVVGEDARPIYDAARLEGMTPEEATLVRDADAAISFLDGALADGDVVLVKASRVVGLERVAEALSEEESA